MLSDSKRSVLWSGVQQASVSGINFLITIVVARILSPSDYGLIAMLSIFFAFSQAFIDSGLTSALIQKEKCTDEDCNTVLVFSIGISLLFYFLFFIGAPLIANIYNEPLLVLITRVYSINIVFHAIGNVAMTLLQRHLDFKYIAQVSMLVSIFSGIVAIIMAYGGMAYWALVFQYILSSLLTSVLFMYKARWKPSMKFSKESFFSMINYGIPVMLSSLVNSIYNNIYSLLIGSKYSASDLGYFNRAFSFSSFIPYNLSNFSMRALFPIFSRIKDEESLLKGKILDTIHHSLFVVIPLNLFVLFFSTEIITIVLTEKWLPMSFILQVLCIANVCYIYTNVHTTIFKSTGATKLLFKCDLVKRITGITIVLFTLWYGINVMVIGLLLYSLFEILVGSYFIGKVLRLTYFEQIKESATPVISSVIAYIPCMLLDNIVYNIYMNMIILAFVFSAFYIASQKLFRNKSLNFFIHYIK